MKLEHMLKKYYRAELEKISKPPLSRSGNSAIRIKKSGITGIPEFLLNGAVYILITIMLAAGLNGFRKDTYLSLKFASHAQVNRHTLIYRREIFSEGIIIFFNSDYTKGGRYEKGLSD